jgi:SulP family sulfate permease
MSISIDNLKGQLVKGLSAGMVIGITDLFFVISLATLIFSGNDTYIVNGIGLILLGSIPALLLVGLLGSYKGSITMPQDAPAAILAVMAASILQILSSATPREKFITVVATVIFTSLLTGLLFLLLGQFKLGSLVRFLPYPVIGGFLAGTGWLLVTGGIGVMTDMPFNFANLGVLFQPGILLRWAPGFLLALVMLGIMNRYSHFLVLPGMLAGIAILFYLTAFLTHTPISVLSSEGWLLGPFDGGTLLQSFSLGDLGLIQWDAIFMQAGSMASIMLISIVSLLLNASALELVIRRDLDLNRELRVVGLANILAGMFGGSVSFHVLSATAINHKLSKGSIIPAFVTTALFALPLFFGAAILSYIPKMMLASLLITFGLSFLYEWVYRAFSNFSRIEYVVILLILLVIATVGYLQGVAIGVVAAVILFVVNYSRVSVTRHALSGAEQQSRFTRSPSQRRMLIEQGGRTYILQLQGYIFFGTANKLLEQVRERIEQTDQTTLKFVVLDFAKVSGLDSTAMLSFSKMKQILQDRGITILVTGSSKEILNQLQKGSFIAEDGAVTYPDLDHGLEWVENQILKGALQTMEQPLTLKEMFQGLLPNDALLDELFNYLEKNKVKKGDYLMRQADSPDNIYFVESGQVTAQLENPGQPPVRLETMKSGRVIGELGFYLGQTRTAAVVADEPSVIYLLSAKNLAKMEKRSPEVASYFHQLIIQLLAERTTHLIRTVAALEK